MTNKAQKKRPASAGRSVCRVPASKFVEQKGEDLEPNMKATTKDNLEWRDF